MTEVPSQSSPKGISPEQARLLLTAAARVNQSLDPHKVAEVALRLAFEVVDAQLGMVLLFQGKQRISLASRGFSPDWLRQFQSPNLDLSGTLIDQAKQAGLPKIFSDLRLVSNDASVKILQQSQLQSLACLPLRAPGNMMGLLLLGDPEPRVFKLGEVDLLQSIASQIGIGLRNAWLFTQSQRRLDELESVTEVARSVVSSLDSDEILTRIMKEVTILLDCEAAAILLLDPVLQELEFAAVAGPQSANLKGVRLQMGQGIVGWVAQHDQAALVPDVSQDERFFKDLDKKTATVTRSVICVPLRVRERLIGVVEVLNKKRGQFTSDDQRMLESMSNFAAVAISNAQFYEEAVMQVQQATLYARDLSSTYKRERQQREALDRLRYNFLNVVGHELKTPLTVILQGLETLKNPRRGQLSDEQSEIVNMLDKQTHYLEQLIKGLTNFATFSARQGTMQFKEMPFEAALDDALQLAQFKAKRKRITLEDQRQPPLPTLLMDRDRMSEAILHLIDNAIKFSPESGRVVVQTESENNNLLVRVVDWGCGIPADQLDTIWDSFVQMSTTMERGLEGLGLGLAIARYIVESHNGQISVQSEVGKGSTFTICLPVASHAASS